MSSQGVFLEIRDLAVAHAVEIIVRMVVFAHMVDAEVEIFPVVAAALGSPVRCRLAAAFPLAGWVARRGRRVLGRAFGRGTDGIKVFGTEFHEAEYDPSAQGIQP